MRDIMNESGAEPEIGRCPRLKRIDFLFLCYLGAFLWEEGQEQAR